MLISASASGRQPVSSLLTIGRDKTDNCQSKELQDLSAVLCTLKKPGIALNRNPQDPSAGPLGTFGDIWRSWLRGQILAPEHGNTCDFAIKWPQKQRYHVTSPFVLKILNEGKPWCTLQLTYLALNLFSDSTWTLPGYLASHTQPQSKELAHTSP